MAKKSLSDQVEEITARIRSELKTNSKVAMRDVAKQTIDAMKKSIAVGKSPIEGEGRYRAYLAVQRKRVINNVRKSTTNKQKKKQLKGRLAQVQQGYPYNQMSNYTGKKITPVNLKLSGSFLSNLIFKIREVDSGVTADIGFFDELSVKKESGHREGVNGQPERPIIPIGSEQISVAIQKLILKIFKATIDTLIKRVDK